MKNETQRMEVGSTRDDAIELCTFSEKFTPSDHN